MAILCRVLVGKLDVLIQTMFLLGCSIVQPWQKKLLKLLRQAKREPQDKEADSS